MIESGRHCFLCCVFFFAVLLGNKEKKKSSVSLIELSRAEKRQTKMASNNFGQVCRDYVAGSLQVKDRVVLDAQGNLSVRNADVDCNLRVRKNLIVDGNLNLPKGYICGLCVEIITSEGDTTGSLRITEGDCRGTDNHRNLCLSAPVTVDLSTSGANGLDTGSASADEWYAVHVIGGKEVPTAGLLSLSGTAPTLPTGYTAFRRVGWARTYDAGESDVHFIPIIQKCKGKCRWYCYDWWHLNLLALYIYGIDWIDIGWLPVDLSPFIPPTSCSADIKVQFNNFFVSPFAPSFVNPPARFMFRVPGSVTTVEGIGQQPDGNEVILGSPVIVWAMTKGGIISESLTVCTDDSQQIEAVLMSPSGFPGIDEDRPAQIVVTGFHDEV
jgi:hypothetical protein